MQRFQDSDGNRRTGELAILFIHAAITEAQAGAFRVETETWSSGGWEVTCHSGGVW